jgi:hypothetical protein
MIYDDLPNQNIAIFQFDMLNNQRVGIAIYCKRMILNCRISGIFRGISPESWPKQHKDVVDISPVRFGKSTRKPFPSLLDIHPTW